MDDRLSGEALRLHLVHCDGCQECSHVSPDGRPYGATWPEHPDVRARRLQDRYFGPDALGTGYSRDHVGLTDDPDVRAQMFGPGEDYEGRESR